MIRYNMFDERVEKFNEENERKRVADLLNEEKQMKILQESYSVAEVQELFHITEDEARTERYNEMQLRLETIQRMRWIISEGIVEIAEHDYLIHAYEILNEVEKDAWDYINTGKY